MSKVTAKSSKPKKDNSENSGAINIPIKSDEGLFLSALHPKYLHTNSTSHTWPFSAVAELIDNAYDPDVNASQLFIDLKTFNGQNRSLVFTDNGNGMSPNKLYKMLSFGFCEKVAVNDHLPVGHYGNGFKSGSMRLGKDALVFTKTESRWSLGFLSQTYLNKSASDTIIVPIATWEPKKFSLLEGEMGGKKSVSAILEHSVMDSTAAIKQEFQEIEGTTGTRIVISNLRRQSSGGKFELDFIKDCYDIRIPDDLADSDESKYKREQRQDHIPASDYSLRAYCSILYLKPRMQIILRNKKVKTTVVARSLAMTEVDTYRPYTPSGYSKPVKIVFGFSQNKNHYGIMMYHRNRLIKPYVRVGHQEKQNSLGVGVIGVIECDFLQPTHNKQDFDYTKAFRACMMGLGRKLNEYWQEKKSAKKSQPQVAEETEKIVPDQKWVQCDNPHCLKWRMLPDTVDLETLPEKWYCEDHPLPEWRSCDIAESLEVEEKTVKPYTKEVKRQLEKEKKQKRQSAQNNDKNSSQIVDMAEKNKKELEIEKKKRLMNEQKAKEQEAEIKRLTLELQKSASVPSNLNKQDTSSPAVRPRPASATPGKPDNQVSSSPAKPAKQTPIKKNPALVVVTTATDSTTKSVSKPISAQVIISAPGNIATLTQASNQKPTVILSPVPAKVPPYPTRQSINQAIKVRLPFLGGKGGKTPLTIAPSPSASVPASPSPLIAPKPISNPPQLKQFTTVVRGVNAAGKPVMMPAKSTAILSQNIRLSPAQVSRSIGNLTTLQNATLPTKVLTVLRFTEASKTPVNISTTGTKAVVNNYVTPGTMRVRPALPVAAPSRFSNPSQAIRLSTPISAANSLTPSPSSHDINQQLAQIGIDAIVAQTDQDIKPVVLNAPPQQLTQAALKPSMSFDNKPALLKTNPPAVTNGNRSLEAKEKQNQQSAPKRKADDDDVQIISATPSKLIKKEATSSPAKTSTKIVDKEHLIKLTAEKPSNNLKLEIPPEILKSTDKDVIDELNKLPPKSVLGILAQRSQQLKDLRQSVCKLLGVLVPDLDLPESGHKSLDDNMIDALLKDVLDANTDSTKKS